MINQTVEPMNSLFLVSDNLKSISQRADQEIFSEHNFFHE